MTLKLQPEFYNYMLNGTKRIEIRLNDQKRQGIKLGDIIRILKEPNLEEYFEVRVIGLLRYNNFTDMFNDFNISILADKSMTKENLLNELEKYYSKDQQEEYGVLGIRIELVQKTNNNC